MQKTWLLALYLMLPCWGAWAGAQDTDGDCIQEVDTTPRTQARARVQAAALTFHRLSWLALGSAVGGHLGNVLAAYPLFGGGIPYSYLMASLVIGPYTRLSTYYLPLCMTPSALIFFSGFVDRAIVSQYFVDHYSVLVSTFLGANLGALLLGKVSRLLAPHVLGFLNQVTASARPSFTFCSTTLALCTWIALQVGCYHCFQLALQYVVILPIFQLDRHGFTGLFTRVFTSMTALLALTVWGAYRWWQCYRAYIHHEASQDAPLS